MLTPANARIKDFVPELLPDYEEWGQLPSDSSEDLGGRRGVPHNHRAIRRRRSRGAARADVVVEPLATLTVYGNFRGLAARAYQRLEERSAAARTVWDVADEEVVRRLDGLDEFRRNLLRDLKRRYDAWSWAIRNSPREDVSSDPDAFAAQLDRTLSGLQDNQQAMPRAVERTAQIIKDWIVTVRSADLPSADEQLRARRYLVAKLQRILPDSVVGSVVPRSIVDGIKAALDAHDVVVMGELTFDTAPRRYLASQMEMLAQQNVGAVLVQTSRELQPVLDGFARTRNRVQLVSDLQAARIGPSGVGATGLERGPQFRWWSHPAMSAEPSRLQGCFVG